jgi:hypothetical protein
MIEYPKIHSIFKRDEKTHKFMAEFSLPEFEYLADNIWQGTEKIDGTNLRIFWDHEKQIITFGGRQTIDNQIPKEILTRMQELFPIELLQTVFPDNSVLLFGEGYGGKIQGMGKYYGYEIKFDLFDVLIGRWWLERRAVFDIASKLKIHAVPVLFEGTLLEAIEEINNKIKSYFGEFQAEGLVLRPKTELFARNGRRIITKIKHKDFL